VFALFYIAQCWLSVCPVVQITSLQNRLTRLAEVVHKNCPKKLHLVPSPAGIDISKLGNGDVIMTDTCNTAQKVRRIPVDLIPGGYELDCMNHLRNVWFRNVEKALSTYLSASAILRTSLDKINPVLHVTASISAIIHTVDKEFSLSFYYPNRHGKLFWEWIREHYPGILLLHVECAAGLRQDLCTEGSLLIYMNYPYYVEFLDSALRKPRKTKYESARILQKSLFVVLTSSEMIDLVQLLSILHLSICMPFRYLADKSHKFQQYGWGAADMGRVLDTLYENLQSLRQNLRLILDQSFMMTIFKQYCKELPPFHEYWEIIFKKKQMKVISWKDGSKVVHNARLLKNIFSPLREANLKTTDRVHELGSIAATTIITELLDQNKATYKYLSVSKSEFSHRYSTEDRKKSLIGLRATNDEALSVLDGAIANIRRYGGISLFDVGAVGEMKLNAFLYRPTKSRNSVNPLGKFHQFDPSLQDKPIGASPLRKCLFSHSLVQAGT
jgi:hypothetical protein